MSAKACGLNRTDMMWTGWTISGPGLITICLGFNPLNKYSLPTSVPDLTPVTIRYKSFGIYEQTASFSTYQRAKNAVRCV